MGSKSSGQSKAPAERVVKEIRGPTRRHFSAEDKIRIVLEGLRCAATIAGTRAQRRTSDSLPQGLIRPVDLS